MKRWVGMGMVSIALLSGLPAANHRFQTVSAAPSPLPFRDLEATTPYVEDIQALYRRGVVDGYPDGTFRPTAQITRAEFSKLVLAAGQCLDCEFPPVEVRSSYRERPFPDVPATAWYFYCVSIAKRQGLVTGYLGGAQRGNYLPEDGISRAESIAVLLRASAIAPLDSEPFALDDVAAGAWYRGYLQRAAAMGLVPVRGGFIRPEDRMTRAEFAHLANRIMTSSQCERPVAAPPDEDGDGLDNATDACPAQSGPRSNRGCPEGTDPEAVTSDSDVDGDGVVDRSDRCVAIPGPVRNQGCPDDSGNASPDTTDRDGDGVAGADDRCPTVFGPAANGGCPYEDRDRDGVLDKDDRCIDVPGDENSDGCPAGDRDGDEVTDADDRCPDLPGTTARQGCLEGGPGGLGNDRDGDGIWDADDRCPDVPGTIAARGCPEDGRDGDGDGVVDADDDCPAVSGPVGNRGCPSPDADWDGDGIANGLDLCPFVRGTERLRGCPERSEAVDDDGSGDRDGDGIGDLEDWCPAVPGPAVNRGCPPPDIDWDGDGVPNDTDRCPLQFGLETNQGCPPDVDGNTVGDGDRDADGVKDRDDACITVPGVRENQGCPWTDTDGDGLPDPNDRCPLQAGPASNRGCPLGDGSNGNTNGSGTGDRDGDGVPDVRDLCPDIPDTLRHATAQNGCPFRPAPNPRDSGPVRAAECRTCPCPAVSEASDLRPGDVIYAAIMDATGSRIYGRSAGWVVR